MWLLRNATKPMISASRLEPLLIRVWTECFSQLSYADKWYGWKDSNPQKCGGRSSVPYPLGYTHLFIKDDLFNKPPSLRSTSKILLIYSDTGKMKLSMKERPTYFSPWAKPCEPGRDWLPALFTNHSAFDNIWLLLHVILLNIKNCCPRLLRP